tara:strand:- start:388 stop:561 length:174 start_codon:yes stop_codon:yes gene_type:complete
MIISGYSLALILYLLGALFILTLLESTEGKAHKLIFLALTWPVATVYMVIMDIFTSE